MPRSILRIGLVLAAGAALALSGDAPGQDAVGPTIVLDTSSFWRYHYTLRTPVVTKAEGVEELEFKCETPLPPAGWPSPDFDDGAWHRVRGAPFPSVRSTWANVSQWDVGSFSLNMSSPCLALICARAKFHVDDPARVKDLTLSVGYRGGVVVYLNGREIARGHLPKDAPITPGTLADGYPDEAYLYPDGSLLDCDYRKADGVKDRYLMRTRTLSGVKVPADALRKGVNVLAIAVHRAPYPAFLLKKFEGQPTHRIPAWLWDTCGVVSVRAESQDAGGVVPNVTRPKGFQVWNSDVLASDFDLDFGDPNDPVRPVCIIGTRGGAFSGKVVVGSDEPIRGLRAAVGPLVRRGGGGAIAASAVRVRYALPWGGEVGANGHYPADAGRLDALEETAPDEVPVQTKEKTRDNWVRPAQPTPVFGAVAAVWLTVNVPENVPAGEYEGTLTVAADNVAPVHVPVRLKVYDWKMPPPHDFRTFVELVQSPDSLALHYEVPLWSERHFQLIERAFRLLGEVGSRTVYVPLICHTNLGNEQTMVRWVKQPEGKYGYDFSVLDRYLDLYEKYCGEPEAVCIGVWEVFLEGGTLTYAREGPWVPHDIWEEFDRAKGLGPLVTLVDPAEGNTRELQLPLYTKDERSRGHWKALLEQLRQRMRARGWEKRMMLGYVHDSIPAKEVVELFRELLPGVPWVRQAHSACNELYGVPCALQMVVWWARFPVYADVESACGWRKALVHFPRGVRDEFPLTTFRLMGELNITGGQRGFGRLGADFWPVLKDSRGRPVGTVVNRYPQSSCRNLAVAAALLAPGKDGPVSTARLEMMREGLQECEARIFLEETLLDEVNRGKLGEDLVRRCRAALDERVVAIAQGSVSHGNCGFAKMNCHDWWNDAGQVGSRWYLVSGWQERSDALYALASEVARALANAQ